MPGTINRDNYLGERAREEEAAGREGGGGAALGRESGRGRGPGKGPKSPPREAAAEGSLLREDDFALLPPPWDFFI